jgi:hypothetical protein
MPIPGPGTAISMNTIAAEFGGTVPHSLNEYYRGGGLVPNIPANAAIPTSGTIAIGNFYGSSSRLTVSVVISGNTQNFDVFANRSPAYVAGATDLVVTVNPGVFVGSASTAAYAMLVPSSFSPTDTVTIVNNGVIQGMGGGGGGGQPFPTPFPPISLDGAGGGNAVFVNRPTTITNNGTLAGGGGGGGASSSSGPGQPGSKAAAGNRRGGDGGGGGAGFNGGAGGAAGTCTVFPSNGPGQVGSPGNDSAGGAGGIYFGTLGTVAGGPGGGRGAAGAAGTAGTGFTPRPPGGAGGAAGNYIVGNPFVTYPATGTRQGGVA